MAKYIKNYLTVSAATEATDILSPNVTYIQDREKLLMADLGDNKELEIVVDGSGEPKIQEKVSRDYLTFTCIETGGISLSNYGDNAPNIEYSLNGGEWTNWDYSNISLTTGNVVKMKGINENGISSSYSKYSQFVMTGKIAASGNIMSLIDGEKDGTKVLPYNRCYCRMFRECSSLTAAPELPATTLRAGCYNSMFQGCSSLTTAPELPATTLKNVCYEYMFFHCTALTSTPELPAATLAIACYKEMFEGCTNLSSVTCLATDISATGCTTIWLKDVATSGTFVKNSAMSSWPTGDDGIPSGWTVIDAE